MSEHREKVRNFFDRAAVSYRKKRGSFTDYYFGQRLSLAITAAQLTDQDRILDIGCGTGELYDQLALSQLADHYLGIDLSKQMLAASNIPAAKQRHLAFADFDRTAPPEIKFDRIFALGLTTYLSESSIEDFHRSVFARLSPGGSAIISYTNADSWDYHWRKFVNRWAGKLLPNHRTLGRDFPIYATTPAQLQTQLGEELLSDASLIWLPAAWPLPGFLPPALIRRSRGGARWRGDFMMVATRPY